MTISATVTHSKTLIAPDSGAEDKVYGSDYVSASSHAVAWAGLGTNQLLYSTDATTLAQSSGLTFDGSTFTIAAGTVTTDIALLSLTRTNNNAAVATGVKIVYTDTTSAAGFLPFQILGGAAATTNCLSVGKTGDLSIGGGISTIGQISVGASAAIGIWNSTNLRIPSGEYFGWSSAADNSALSDVNLSRLAAGSLALGTGAANSFAGSLKLTNVTAVGDVTAATYHVGATAGADFGPGLPTSITVVKGIVTAIS